MEGSFAYSGNVGFPDSLPHPSSGQNGCKVPAVPPSPPDAQERSLMNPMLMPLVSTSSRFRVAAYLVDKCDASGFCWLDPSRACRLHETQDLPA